MTTAAAPSALRAWVAATRPATLWAAVVPVAVGLAVAAEHGPLEPLVATASLAVALLLQLASNFANDAADGERGVDGPDRLGPARAVAMGWLSSKQMKRAAVVCVACALVVGGWLAVIGGPILLAVGAAAVVCALAYTAGPVPLGYIGLGDFLVLLFFGVTAVCGTYFLQRGDVTPSVALASLAIGALATAILVVNNLRDRVGDARNKKWTLAARFGARFARVEYTLLIVAAYLAIAVVASSDTMGWLLPFVSLPVGAWLVVQIWRRDGAALNPLLAATARLELLFGALLCFGVWL